MIAINSSPVYDFGLRLKALRKKAGLTQEEVANRLGLNKNNISRYENNVQSPTIETLRTLAVLYHTSTDYMLGLSDRTNLYIDYTTKQVALISDFLDRIKGELNK